jgi:hypothetical protein
LLVSGFRQLRCSVQHDDDLLFSRQIVPVVDACEETIYRSNMLTMITNAQLFRTDLGTEGQLSQSEQQWCLLRAGWLLQLSKARWDRLVVF